MNNVNAGRINMEPLQYSGVQLRLENGPRDGADAVLLAALVAADDPVRVSTELEIG